MSLEEKVALFAAWTMSDGEDGDQARDGQRDDDLDSDEREHRRKSRAFAAAAALKRAARDGDNTAETSGRGSASVEPAAIRPVSSPLPSSDASTSTKDLKRKRGASNTSPEGDTSRSSGIFDGLAFYYIPNANLGPRKLRIAKARQNGAQWVQHISEATHVIVDKKLSWKDIQVVLRDGTATQPSILVNEEYPLDCIRFRRLLNLDQGRYYIRGSPASTKAATATTKASSQRQEARSDDRTHPIKRQHSRHYRPVTPSPPQEESWAKKQRRQKTD
ncbi:DNA polymerase [Grosmannia clavigera kw1407]|uniref:DNA polymerase n=1 Tax=Grosmannia clavigera (strain kw1407 / UAMH 11150) TaxID=655863 RepID=F0XDC9_GROCL|nr:DNA polymerase [Grosmannia clavigera kw1407]EFX03877.1 DNA polymerase [Grosmannia clavigera kw1407]